MGDYLSNFEQHLIASNVSMQRSLNQCDGHIGCGRKRWNGSGGNECALRHYSELRDEIGGDRKQYFALVVKLGTIGKYGADVFDYTADAMVMEAAFKDGDAETNTALRWTNSLCLGDL